MTQILGNKNFLFLFSGQAVSTMGNWINYVGLNAYIYHVYGSGKILGLFLLVRLLPALFFGSLGGILADRYDRRVIMVACDCARALMVLAFLATKEMWHFFLLGFLLSGLDRVFTACYGSLMPDIVRKEELLEANSVSRMSTSVITILGPAIGGALIGFCGYHLAFIIDSATFVFSVLSLLLITVPRVVCHARENRPAGIAGELKETGAFLLSSSLLLSFLFLRFLDGLGSGSYNTVLPVFASAIPGGGGGFYGYLIAFWGGGTFLGSMAAAVLRKKMAFNHLFCGSMVIMAFGMGSTFHASNILLASAAIAIGGFGDGISSVLFATLLMEAPPRHLRGKVFGTVTSFLYVLAGLGMFLAGFCLDGIKYFHITDAGSLLIIAGTLAVWGIQRKDKGESP